ncbi:MAG: sulfatase [Pseudopedobacter saltans]|uniref:Sulfatase n=1 Tax=Pseudopedobacter saltans TaxID=151895 RepID=A0A2W5GPM6_9SPHI|nr:MAG: sulfatase [Pseudopedobacter saltans]
MTRYRMGRFSLLCYFCIYSLLLNFSIRIVLLFLAGAQADLSFITLCRLLGLGLIYDIGVSAFLVLPYSFFLLVLPDKLKVSILEKTVTYSVFILIVFITIFSAFAEILFWKEFESRFNFIAVDYLIYTYEVVKNISESYPLWILLPSMSVLAVIVFILFYKTGIFEATFKYTASLKKKATLFVLIGCVVLFYSYTVDNSLADKGTNRYQNELAKSGIYSFFSAFKNNEINYDDFYKRINSREAFSILRKDLVDSMTRFYTGKLNIDRNITNSSVPENRPNVIMLTLESFSAEFMEHFGNRQGLTPCLDSLAQNGILFTNMYATGTRTVRGMEALTLAVPPTPGNSIVRRKNNEDLFTVGSIFRSKHYATTFFYGGDGYFDNMNMFFGNNGYDIIDHPRQGMLNESIRSVRKAIPPKGISFENAWGVCDEDIYAQVLKDADNKYSKNERFYDFVMTTSNHRPFTYPSGKVNIPSGTSREGAIKYTDYAIATFLKNASKKEWFKNTVFIITADHCAQSAGKNQIDVGKYHIPAMFLNMGKVFNIEQLTSQIDIYPTLFNILGWNYNSKLFGKNVLAASYHPRAFVSTYQKLGYIENDSMVILSPQQQISSYTYDFSNNKESPCNTSNPLLERKAIAYYQTAYFLFKHNGMKER